MGKLFKNFTWEEDGQVFFTYYTGWPSSVADGIRRSVAAYSRHGAFHQKIGITNHPVRRWRQAYRDKGWGSMQVIYMSTCHGHVCDLESMMVNRFFEGMTESKGYYWNATGGGGGRIPHNGPYYLYVVNGEKYARISR